MKSRFSISGFSSDNALKYHPFQAQSLLVGSALKPTADSGFWFQSLAFDITYLSCYYYMWDSWTYYCISHRRETG